MALKSIIDLELNDAAFRRFKDLFDKYDKALKSQPAAWALITQKISGTRSSFDKVVSQMVAQNVQAKLFSKAQEEADRRTRTMADRWSAAARSTGTVLKNVRETTGYLLRWGTITGAIGGLLGVGSLFGIDQLAGGVGATRRSALGLGLTFGEQRSFATNFSRLVDPESFLQSVSSARFDVTRRVGLLGAGLSQQEASGDTATTAVALLQHLRQIAQNTNPAFFAQVIQARRLGEFVSPQDLERLRETSPQEFNQLVNQYRTGASQFGLPPDVARQWQELSTQLTRAGQGIENTFIRGLAPLTPALSKLSESFEKVVHSFLQSPDLSRWIEKADKALEQFASEVGTEKFQDQVKKFAENVGKIGDFIAWLASKIPDGSFGTKIAGGAAGAAVGAAIAGPVGAVIGGVAGYEAGGVWSAAGRTRWNGGFVGDPSGGLAGLQMNGIGMDALLSIVRRSERSGVGAVSPAGAIGTYQIEPATGAMYGASRDDLFNPAVNEAVARKYLAYLVRKYHGNTAQVLAAYNSGPGREDKVLAGRATMPGETMRYVTRAQAMEGYAPTVVTIDDNTGGNVNISTNALK